MSADVSSTPSPGIDWGAIAAELSAAASSGGPAAEPSGVADVPDGQVTKDVNAAGTPDNQADNGNKPAVPVAEVFTPAQIAQLAREEREARELKAKLDAELKALEPVKGELETLRAKVKEAGSRFKEDPAGVLEDAGVPPEQWLEIAELLFFSVDPSKASPDLQYKLNNRKQERRLAKMQAELNARLQAAEEARQREAQEAPIRAIIASLEAYAMAAPD